MRQTDQSSILKVHWLKYVAYYHVDFGFDQLNIFVVIIQLLLRNRVNVFDIFKFVSRISLSFVSNRSSETNENLRYLPVTRR